MNGYQVKQKNKIIDPNRIPRRPLDDYELKFQEFLRKASDDKELSEGQNSFLNKMAALYS